jgi:hypothetical protein
VEWPQWLRRHTGVDQLPEPRVFFAWTAIALAFGVIAYVGCWNAAKYPIVLGYDYNSNAQYMHVLLSEHRLPTQSESLESRQPPVYYLVGGLAARAGHAVFGWHEEPTTDLPEHTYRGAQLLNVLFALLTGVVLLSLARMLAPRSPGVWAAAMGFFAFLPVVAKTEAMIHAETLNMLLSTTALWLAVRIATRGTAHKRRLMLLLVLTLTVGLATRASIVFTAAAIVVALAVQNASRLHPRRVKRHIVPIAAALALAIGGVVWIEHGGAHNGTLANLAHPASGTQGPRKGFFQIPVRAMFQSPFRSNYAGAAFGETYTEIWGDWIGSFAWSTFQGAPTGEKLTVLRNQSWIGVIPTILAIAGYLWLAVLAVARRREFLALALMVPLAVAAYMYRSWLGNAPDGDLFKASYILTTAPVWALGFGLSYGALGRFPWLRAGLAAALVVFAVMELRFMMYGLRDGTPPY